MTSSEKILQKALVASDLDSSQWNGIQAALRDRAFFSSQVAEMKILHAARSMVAEQAAGGKSLSEIRRDLRSVISSTGYNPGDERGTIKDLYTKARLDVLIKTNVAQARGYIQHLEATTPGGYAAFPAQELIRTKARKAPRNWAKRWEDAGGKIFEGRMIALKDDPVWTKISAFGNPFPPFDFGSGMGVRGIKRSEAVRLGLITAEEVKTKVKILEEKRETPGAFNANLETEDKDGNLYGALKKVFGDQIRRVDGKLVWRQELLRETLFTDNFKIALGIPQEDGMLKKLSADKLCAPFAEQIRGKQLTVTQDWRDTKRKDGTTHLAHFSPLKDHPEDIPLQIDDVELLPALWRNPDRAMKIGKDLFLVELDAIDGSTYVAQIKISKSGVPKLWTYFKTTMPTSKKIGRQNHQPPTPKSK